MSLERKMSLIVLCLFIGACSASNILAVFPMHYKSHFVIGGNSLVKNLADRGHSVTIISQFDMKHKNVEAIVIDTIPKEPSNVFSLADISIVTNFVVIPQITEKAINYTLSHEKVARLLKEKRKFDAVIVEIFMTETLYGLGVHFDCPVIGLTTFGVSMWTNLITRTPFPPSYIPNLFTPYSDKMNFFERFFNTWIWSVEEALWHYIHYPKQVALYEKFFPIDKPELIKVIRNVSLILNNNHFSTTTIKPTVPNVIDIGGIHVRPAKPLPSDLQKFLDSADDGAILFSMGSVIQATDWPVDKREAIVKALGKLKEKVIWKYENETLPNKPDNVMISSWIPQRDILAHPKIKLFITHGGLLGTTEALAEGVPILAIPIYGDQKMNIKVAIEKGIGLMLDFHKFDESDLSQALDKILNDDQIRNNAKKASDVYWDRPMSAQDTAAYWVEYVIRHKGAPHLRSAALDMNYIAFNNIDVYLVFAISLLCLLYSVKILLCKIFLRKVIKQKTQ